MVKIHIGLGKAEFFKRTHTGFGSLTPISIGFSIDDDARIFFFRLQVRSVALPLRQSASCSPLTTIEAAAATPATPSGVPTAAGKVRQLSRVVKRRRCAPVIRLWRLKSEAETK